jgi:hypothetical protein
LEALQRNAWLAQISILQREFAGLASGWVAFEFAIPRMIDATHWFLNGRDDVRSLHYFNVFTDCVFERPFVDAGFSSWNFGTPSTITVRPPN